MYWHIVATAENSPFLIVATRYVRDNDQLAGYGYAIARDHGYGARGRDYDVLTREQPRREVAERILANYDRWDAWANDDALVARLGKGIIPALQSGQITTRENRHEAGSIVSYEDKRRIWHNMGNSAKPHRTIAGGLDERFNHTPSSSAKHNLLGSSFIDLYHGETPWRTIDIVPDGDSPVSAPTYTVWYDGHMEVHTYEDFDGAVAGAFYEYAWPGGDNVAYPTDDGDLLCGPCAAEEWIEHGVAFKPQVEHDEYGTGVACENQGGDHEGWIAKPQCVECRAALDELHERNVVIYHAAEAETPHFLCEHCVESLVNGMWFTWGETQPNGTTDAVVVDDDRTWFTQEGVVYTAN